MNIGKFPLHCFVALLLQLTISKALAVDVWITSGDQSRLLQQQTDVVFQPGNGSGGSEIFVIDSATFQTIEGFGAAMTNSSASLLQNNLNSAQRDRLINNLFSKEDGIGLNYLRVPMGASDFTATGHYTYNDLPAGQVDPTQSNFSIAPDQQEIIPSLQEIKAVNQDLKLMASPWSAPAWMKTSGSLYGGSLSTTYQASYAIYLRKFIEAYEAEGLPIDAITLQNEPLFQPSDYPGMEMLAPQQIDLIKNYVGPQFAAAGVTSKIIAYDHNWDNTQYAIDVLNDAQAAQYVAGTAFHGYAGDVSAQSVVHSAHPDKAIYFTEISGGDFAPNFEDNLVWYARNLLIGVPRNWGSTVLLWNLALDENHGPHLGGCTDCRGVVTVNSNGIGSTVNEEFYALGHLSQHLQEGAVRISSTTLQNLETVAFLNPDGSRVLFALNSTGSNQDFRALDGGEHFSYSVPARSVATFVWDEDDEADFNNGSFEKGGYDTTGGSLDGWLPWGVNGGNVSVTTSASVIGNHSLRLSEPASFNGFSGVSQGVSVEPGDRITLDADVQLPLLGSIAGTGSSVSMKIEYYSSFDGVFQSSDFISETTITLADGTDTLSSWISRQIEDVAPANAVEARIVFVYSRNGFDTGQVYVDEIQLAISDSLPGDFNADGIVDAADYTVWRDNFGATDESALNFSGDGGGVGQGDYDLWLANFGIANSSSSSIAIPEPSTCVLAFCCWICACFHPRKQSKSTLIRQ